MQFNSITRVPTAEKFALTRGPSECVLLFTAIEDCDPQARTALRRTAHFSLELSLHECTILL